MSTSGNSIRAAVIGVGAMGRHHARLYHDLPGSELVAVADADEAIAGSEREDDLG